MALAMENSEKDAARAILRWYAEMGVDEAVAAAPADLQTWGKTERSPAPKPRAEPISAGPVATPIFDSQTLAVPADEAIASAKAIAAGCDSFEALERAVLDFEGCPLKAGARNTVFADGVPGADLLVIGEAPGRDEDSIGKPFVGRAGQLLDKMLAAIGRSRTENVLISNVIYWRPPGNRTPTPIETSICRPFVDRLIDITKPKALVLAGGAPTQALLGLKGIMRARGVWREIETSDGTPIPVMPIFHPAFLLRQPANKRLAWHDLLSLQARLTED